MFEELKDDELEDIIEEEIEEDSENERLLAQEEANADLMLTSQEEREERKEKREELRTLKTQMLTIKEKLQMKTIRIEEIKDVLKKSQLFTHGFKDGIIYVAGTENVIDEVVKEYENLDNEEEDIAAGEAANEEDDDDSSPNEVGEDNGDDDDEDDDNYFDNGLEEIDP